MTEAWGHHVTRYPLHTSHAHGIPATKAGRVLAEIHDRWHVVQFFSFRFVIMWPVIAAHTHRHDWEYGPTTVVGWGVVRCRTCGETDIYA